MQDWRAKLDLDAGSVPDHLGLPVGHLGGVEAEKPPLQVRIRVFFAVADVDEVAVHDRGNVDRAQAVDMAPDALARADLEGMYAAVAAATDKKTFAVDVGDYGIRIIRILDLMIGIAPPHGHAGALVDGEEAVAAASVFTPTCVQNTDDHQVAVDHRAGNPAAVAANPAVLLGHRMRPDHLTRLAVEAEEQALGAVGVDVSSFWVADHRRHHAHSDDEDDTHSPNRGFGWAHMFWWMTPDIGSDHTPEYLNRWSPDLYKDPIHVWLDKYHFIFPVSASRAMTELV